MSSLIISNRVISEDSDCFVIAEVGHNHQGNIELCKKLFDAAKLSGASAVKLQKRSNKDLYTKEFYNRIYNSENAFGPTYGLHREALEFNEEQILELKQYADSLGVIFFVTPFDYRSADFLNGLDTPCFKVASGDLTNIPFLKYVAGFGKPLIISTGAAVLEDVRRAYEAVRPVNDQIAILQCTASYPADPREMDLAVLRTYQREFPDVIVGLSDHYNGIALPVAAYVLGARIVEKHFTINRAMKGTDQVFSLEPAGMQKLVRDLQRTRIAIGDGVKKFYESEKNARQKMGKKIVAARYLPKGHVLREGDLAFKSPGDGLPPYFAEMLYGKRLLVALREDSAIDFKHAGIRSAVTVERRVARRQPRGRVTRSGNKRAITSKAR